MLKQRVSAAVAAGVMAAGAMCAVGGAANAATTASGTTAAQVRRTTGVYVWASAVNFHAGPRLGATVIGQYGPGNLAAYCQVKGDEVTYGGYRNNWWIYADITLGNITNGYVSAVFIKGGANDAPIPGVPVC